jgi:hypothetical protein
MTRTFKTKEDFINKFKEYIKVCEYEQKLPNIAGFCVYCDINRDTFYAQKEYYSDTFKKVNDILEDSTINANINDTFKIFYLKNKFDYSDRQDINANVNTDIKVTLTDD